MRRLPSQSEIAEWLDYNAETGVFRWRKEPCVIGTRLGKVAGTTRANGYAFISFRSFGIIQAHRLAWILNYGSLPPNFEIDHIDGNPSNNAIANLRLATSSQQKQNKRVQRNNRSGLKGAMYHAVHKGKKWRSQIIVEGRCIFLGYFHTAREAHEAYGRAARKHFGEFARLT